MPDFRKKTHVSPSNPTNPRYSSTLCQPTRVELGWALLRGIEAPNSAPLLSIGPCVRREPQATDSTQHVRATSVHIGSRSHGLSIRCDSERIRLENIDAPELADGPKCTDPRKMG